MSAPPFRQGPPAPQPVPVAAGAGPLPAAGSNGGARLAAPAQPLQAPASLPNTNGAFLPALRGKNAAEVYGWFTANLAEWSYDQAVSALEALVETAADPGRTRAFKVLSLLMDRRYPTGRLRRSSLLALVDRALALLVAAIRETPSPGYVAAGQEKGYPGATVVLDARGFDPEGPDSLALELVRLGKTGFQRMIVTHCTGHRFIGSGFGPESEGVRIDVFGSPGDYLASGLDGMAIHVHNNAQDQLAQIMKRGELVVYGDVGQTFMYGAKGGQAYVLGNAAGRPLINAVGKPRVVINGTALDYLAESFMAGDPHNGGGFVILNGVHLNDQGEMENLPSPYPGGNLFSLASGGAIYVRDPHHRVTRDQLNGGEFFPFEARDWDLIRPMLAENERLFGIPVDGLLSVDGEIRSPQAVYRKIGPASVRALQAEEAWVGKH